MASGHIRKREYKSGVSWQIVIENGVDEKGERKRIYKSVKGTKKEAQKIMTKILNELNNGTYIEPTKTSFGDFLKEWMETYVEPNLSPTTIVGYKANVFGHIVPNLGHIPLQSLNALDIQKFYNKLSQENHSKTNKPLSARTIEHIHANLKSALKQAVKLGVIERNPAEAVTIPKAKDYKATVYDEEEVKKLLKYVKGTKLEIPVVLGVGLGLRRGEVLGLKWSAIDFEGKKIKVQTSLAYVDKKFIFKSPKSTAGERTLVVSDSILETLKKHKKEQGLYRLMLGATYENNDLVCCEEDGRPTIPGTLSHRFNIFLQEHDFKEIRFHDLRHTHASLLLKYGVAAKVASTRLGHSSIGITLDLYSHVYNEVEEEAANRIETGIFQIG
ncbi:tyrosine-type recombinase/integrase [Geosporobacter ferrireducens]|uniref:Integrase n=1 Tax=Geosporobacter ferrireducens TaxID=1424294 RepID=A0A1D8GPL4_9FIRM|nr:tyrosine-type recombinase/integrase [Geosporobacter ferrireducens]AOT72808.1 hypothetical protein Gferi_26565 [Geosporobacter ferrireducens]